MKQGGVSWNTSARSKSGVRSRFKCVLCGRNYKMEYAKDNHEKICKEFNDKLKQHETKTSQTSSKAEGQGGDDGK